jgi:hypothetical protein
MNDLDQCLTWRKAFADVIANCFLPDSINKILDHRQCDIRLKQSQAHLSQRVFNIIFGKPAFAGQVTCSFRQPLGKLFEHDAPDCLMTILL